MTDFLGFNDNRFGGLAEYTPTANPYERYLLDQEATALPSQQAGSVTPAPARQVGTPGPARQVGEVQPSADLAALAQQYESGEIRAEDLTPIGARRLVRYLTDTKYDSANDVLLAGDVFGAGRFFANRFATDGALRDRASEITDDEYAQQNADQADQLQGDVYEARAEGVDPQFAQQRFGPSHSQAGGASFSQVLETSADPRLESYDRANSMFTRLLEGINAGADDRRQQIEADFVVSNALATRDPRQIDLASGTGPIDGNSSANNAFLSLLSGIAASGDDAAIAEAAATRSDALAELNSEIVAEQERIRELQLDVARGDFDNLPADMFSAEDILQMEQVHEQTAVAGERFTEFSTLAASTVEYEVVGAEMIRGVLNGSYNFQDVIGTLDMVDVFRDESGNAVTLQYDGEGVLTPESAVAAVKLDEQLGAGNWEVDRSTGEVIFYYFDGDQREELESIIGRFTGMDLESGVIDPASMWQLQLLGQQEWAALDGFRLGEALERGSAINGISEINEAARPADAAPVIRATDFFGDR